MNRLKDKIVLITGAAQGIGRTTAELFIEEGAKVIAVDINESILQTLKNAILKKIDITDHQAVKILSQEIGTIDVLFNCAGYVHQGTILNCQEKELDFSWQLNVKAMCFMIQSFLPNMIEAGKGNIINMASVASSVIAVHNRFAYNTTKAAVIGLTKSIAADFVQKGIRCNAIAPGTVESPSLEKRMKDLGGNYNEIRQKFIDRQPMNRIGKSKEIAYLALYLASDESTYTTGNVEIIDGGWANT